MSARLSVLARNGSASSSRYAPSTCYRIVSLSDLCRASIDISSHNHFLSSIRSIPNLSYWLHDAQNHRHERIATGTVGMGMAIITQDIIEMHIQQVPDVRGMMDFLPATDQSGLSFIGWRKKMMTWQV